jgi:hypothetical protein
MKMVLLIAALVVCVVASAAAQTKMNIASYNKQTRVLEAFKRRDGKLVSLGKIRFQSRWNAVTTAAMVLEDAATKVEKEDICNDLLNPF